jgi:hypothetical protein
MLMNITEHIVEIQCALLHYTLQYYIYGWVIVKHYVGWGIF